MVLSSFVASGEFSKYIYVILKGGLHDSAHVHESKYGLLPLHAVATEQVSSFICFVNEPRKSELIAPV